MKSRKSDPLRALSDPIRISLFELIKESEKSTPELAEILNENRMNLYHHLKILEQAGLIVSSYNSDRVKVYRAQSDQSQVKHQSQSTLIRVEPKSDHQVSSVILSPPTESTQKQQFKDLIQELASIAGTKIPNNYEILQVQIMTQEREKYSEKLSRSSSIRKRKSKR